MLIIFTLNIGFYLYSLHIGLDGFNTKLFGGGSDGSLYAQEAVKFAENRPYIYTSIHTPIYINTYTYIRMYFENIWDRKSIYIKDV